MQLFGLVNTMLANDRATAERDLSIARYAVIPLSPNSGLIGWVPNTDTLHALIREYRDARKARTPLPFEFTNISLRLLGAYHRHPCTCNPRVQRRPQGMALSTTQVITAHCMPACFAECSQLVACTGLVQRPAAAAQQYLILVLSLRRGCGMLPGPMS